MEKFFTSKIDEITSTLIDYRGKTPPKTSDGIRLITAKVVKEGTILNENNEYISEDTYEKWMTRGLPQQWDILITTEAPLGEVSQLRMPEKIALAQRIILLRGNPEIVDQDYYFHALKSPFVQAQLEARATGTTVRGIKQSELRQVEVPLYSLPTQRKIAAILSAYDDLIENNARRIAILEEMAQLIYREWFVHYRFPGHEEVEMVDSELGLVPEGWGVRNMDELLQYHIGGSWGKDEPEGDFVVPVYVIRGTDIPGARHLKLDECPFRFLKQSYYDSRELQPGDVIFEVSGGSKDQPVGRPLLVSRSLLDSFDEKVICASFCKLLRVDSRVLCPELFYLHLLEIYVNREIEQYQVQSTGIKNLKFSHFLEEARLPVPDRDLQLKFIDCVRPLFEMIASLGKRNEILRRTRDLLLPRLVSGELDVSDVEIAAGGDS